MADQREDVYCTLVMSDDYLPGAAVLAKSLRDTGTTKKLACMIVQDNLRPSTIEELQTHYNYVIPVSPIASPNVAALYLMRRPDLRYTFTKIQLWRFVQFRRIVYVDADVVALRAPDELFDIPDEFAAAPDVGFPDCFNSGVFSCVPSEGTYEALRTMAAVGDSFDGADQGLLNQYWEHKSWKRLSFTYNCTPSAHYQYEPAYRYYKRDIKMVHFIGSEKPWQKGRSANGSSGAYQELLSRWWAVYDRHFKVSTVDYVSGIRHPPPAAVQRHVKSSPTNANHAYYATGYPAESTQPAPPPPKGPPTSAEELFTDPGERGEDIDQGRIEPTPTVEARRFSAPHMEWDATRNAPPMQSKPEAANFPTATYEFSTDRSQYRPPTSYPGPPRDIPLHYELPKPVPKKEEKLAPIFPWEERELSRPTRRFIEDEPVPAPPAPEPEEDDFRGGDELEVRASDDNVLPSRPQPASTMWEHFDARSKNAWDDVGGIESYVRALTASQKQRGKVQVLVPPPADSSTSTTDPASVVPASTTATSTAVDSASEAAASSTSLVAAAKELESDDLVDRIERRRESLLVTDFPTAIERPSLPVTPAPVRRSTFWGGQAASGEGDGEGVDQLLPQAEGVPRQEDWDPAASLDQLRRNSLIGVSDLKLPERKAIPDRQMVSTAATIKEEEMDDDDVTPTWNYATSTSSSKQQSFSNEQEQTYDQPAPRKVGFGARFADDVDTAEGEPLSRQLTTGAGLGTDVGASVSSSTGAGLGMFGRRFDSDTFDRETAGERLFEERESSDSSDDDDEVVDERFAERQFGTSMSKEMSSQGYGEQTSSSFARQQREFDEFGTTTQALREQTTSSFNGGDGRSLGFSTQSSSSATATGEQQSFDEKKEFEEMSFDERTTTTTITSMATEMQQSSVRFESM